MEWIEIATLVISFLLLLSIGVPIAYSIGISSALTLVLSMDSLTALTTIAQRMGTGLDGFSLLAIPFFILAGQLMNQGGVARRLIDFARTLVGSLPGGLAFVNIVACMLFGAISGSAVAAASAIGGVMHHRMTKEGYEPGFSAAVNISSATTGMIIPPSNILIVYALAAGGGASIAALFLAGYLPGILIGLALMVAAGIQAKRNNYPVGEKTSFRETLKAFWQAIPSLLLLVVVIGGIIMGIFTATEASAIAVVYALVLGFIYKEIKVQNLRDILLATVKTTAIVLLLVSASMAMSWVMAFENIPQQVSELLLSLSDNPFVILLIINLLLLAVGVFMDMTPAVLIFTPIFLPVVTALGMDPVHFGIVMVMNLCIGLCTPPVGSVLFVGAAVANLRISQVVRPLIPLFIVMLIALVATTYVPQLSLWLPSVFGL
ncbi:TRAP transporter large permease [Pontibacter sp. G13]|uniref:TRAP transporter large permease n=1 Tax=Pontibacter sp. G13 TaxID=3074898 RepID=UPI00288B41EA|nr:TRAP transporter large permease [Pontibacter sp. G13]WNJ20994.1 TRAP transporter large permease [Pontibacter sp. G13]